MKKTVLYLLVIVVNFVHAQTQNYILGPIFINASTPPIDTVVTASIGRKFYVSPWGNDSNTGTVSTGSVVADATVCWKTLAKVNAAILAGTILAGDSILFKENYDYLGALQIFKSGTSGSPIVVSSYGRLNSKGNITGLKTLTQWTNAGGGIWNITVPEGASNMNIVTIDGYLERMGRFPDYDSTTEGWLFYNSFSGNVASTSLTGTPNWTGAKMVYKKYSYVTDIAPITAQSGGNLTLGSFLDFTEVAVSPVSYVTNYGYFIQDDIRTLSQYGEWYFNPSTKLLSVYFGAELPTSHTIKAAIVDRVIDCASGEFNATITPFSYIKIVNLSVQGGNKFGIRGFGGTNVDVQKCDIRYCKNAVMEWYVASSDFSNNYVLYCTNTAFTQQQNASGNKTILSNAIKNIGQFEGLGGNESPSMQGIVVQSDNTHVSLNVMDSIGHTPIYFNGGNILIDYNYITNYCNIRDDAGGIYTYNDTTKYNRVIDHNIIVNGIGAKKGRPTDNFNGVHPLYSDGESQHSVWTYNTTDGAQGNGILANTPVDTKFDHNTLYNTLEGITISRFGQTPAHSYIIRDTITNNLLCG